MLRAYIRQYGRDATGFIGGSVLFATGILIFVNPHQLVPGGVTGIALIAEYLWDVPIGGVILAVNLPLLIAAWRYLGREFAIRTIVGTVLSSVTIDILTPFLPPYYGEPLLAALFGGLCIGAGLGMIYRRGGTTGGTEIIAQLLTIRFPHIPLGQLLLAVDIGVIAAGALLFRNIDAVFYAVILVAVSTILLDRVLTGMDAGKLLLIQTNHPDEVTAAILSHIDRGVTRLSATGGYSGKERPLLLCAVRRAQFFPLTQLVHTIDAEAFVVILPTDWVYGNGFRAFQRR